MKQIDVEVSLKRNEENILNHYFNQECAELSKFEQAQGKRNICVKSVLPANGKFIILANQRVMINKTKPKQTMNLELLEECAEWLVLITTVAIISELKKQLLNVTIAKKISATPLQQSWSPFGSLRVPLA